MRYPSDKTHGEGYHSYTNCKQEALFLTEGRDTIIWRWNENGEYTARSMYRVVMEGGLICDRYAALWKFKVPPTVRIFWFLLLKDILLTHDNMQRRNIRCSLPCGLCGNCPVESAFHVFFLCPYAVHIWYIMSNKVGFQLVNIGADIQTTWEYFICNLRARGGNWKTKGISLILCAYWMTWKQRNARIFASEKMHP